MSQSITLTASSLAQFLHNVLAVYALPAEIETALVSHLVDANLYGVDSHGVQQIIGYDKSLKSGRINPKPTLKILSDRTSLIRLDADGSPGQYAAKVGMKLAIDRAKQTGIALVGISNSNHFGMAGYYVRIATEAGMIGFATSDTNVVDLAPYGGSAAKLGNNPLAWGIPTGTDRPVILDMATGAVSGGKIKHFVYQGLPIPLGWGLTAEGQLTADARQSVVNLPASYKGAGLALIADLLCGPLLGTAAALFKTKAIHDAANGTGHILGVLDVAAWVDRSTFEQEVQRTLVELKATPRLAPNQPIYYPGELEAITREARERSGIPLPIALAEELAHYFDMQLLS